MNSKPVRRVFHNAYPSLVRGSNGEFGKNRDAAACCEMLDALQKRGFRFGSMIFNYAQPAKEFGTEAPGDFSFLKPTDLILSVTRIPCHDRAAKNKKFVPQSGTRLEKRIIAAVDRYLKVCSRSHIRIQEEIVAAWEDMQGIAGPGARGMNTKADFKFCQHVDARMTAWSTLDLASRATRLTHGSDYRSIGFFIHVPAIEEFGCSLIVSFGMGSFENLIWNRIVRTKFDRWLDAPVFAVAEMDLNGLPVEPVTLRFASRIPVKLIMEVPGGEASGGVRI